MNKNEKQQSRIERYSSLAKKASTKSEQYFPESEAIANIIPMEPRLDDNEDVEKLEKKLSGLTKRQEFMKTANRIVRDRKLSEGDKITGLLAMGCTDEQAAQLLTPCYGATGFPSCTLSNNNANINRIKKRLELAKRMKSTPIQEIVLDGTRIVEDYPENRLQVFFDDIPDKEIRESLKRNGFRWSRHNKCWQTYLNRRNIDLVRQILGATEDTGEAKTIPDTTDTVKADINSAFQEYIDRHGEEPEYAVCDITWKDNGNAETVNIRLSTYEDTDTDIDDTIFFYCNSLDELKSLCNYDTEDFTVTGIRSFEKFYNNNQ